MLLVCLGEDGVIRIIDLPCGKLVHTVGVAAAHAIAMYKERVAIASSDG
jgi:hypothetical protein